MTDLAGEQEESVPRQLVARRSGDRIGFVHGGSGSAGRSRPLIATSTRVGYVSFDFGEPAWIDCNEGLRE